MIMEDRTVTVRMLANALHINKSTCHQILQEDLCKRKLNARLVPHARTHLGSKGGTSFNLCWLVTRGTERCHFRQQYHWRGWIMEFPVRPSDQEAKRRMAVNGYSTVKESEAAGIDNKDDDNSFFFRRQGYCSSRLCPARVNGQPRSLHLRTQAHAQGTSTSSSWPVDIWTVDSVARQCETTHSSKCLKISH